MLNKDIPVGGFAIVHSNPQDVENHLVTPPSDVTWGVDTNQFGSLSLLGVLNTEAKFQSNGIAGVTVITMACAGKTAQVSVTAVGPVALPFDHFAPLFD